MNELPAAGIGSFLPADGAFYLYADVRELTNDSVAFAERMLRPAVIARKVSHCSKNDSGASAYAAFMSVVQTLKLRKVPSLLDALTALTTPLRMTTK